MATEHLLALGHRKIGAIIGSPKDGIHQRRFDGFRDALRAAHARCPADVVRFCQDTFDAGQEAAGELLSTRPELTALFVSNDLPALGVLNAAAALGRKVPEDLSVLSVTNIPQTAQSRPALTTVAIPTVEMAVRGIELAAPACGRPERGAGVVSRVNPQSRSAHSTCEARDFDEFVRCRGERT